MITWSNSIQLSLLLILSTDVKSMQLIPSGLHESSTQMPRTRKKLHHVHPVCQIPPLDGQNHYIPCLYVSAKDPFTNTLVVKQKNTEWLVTTCLNAAKFNRYWCGVTIPLLRSNLLLAPVLAKTGTRYLSR